jgi:DNA replication and repair protein RecF
LRLQRLTLRDFRNLPEAQIEFASGFTVLWGHNGAGKTNVLEAIYLVSTLRSFRSSDLGPLVRHDSDAAFVELQAHDSSLGVSTSLEVRLQRHATSTRRTAVADGKSVRSAAQFYGRVRAVLFTPEDLGVLRGSPSGRRQFLDRVLFARDRGHITDIQQYEKLLRSRNRVLKDDRLGAVARDDMLSTYEVGLSEVGARVWTRRAALLEDLGESFADNFQRIHGHRGATPSLVSSPTPAPRATLRYVTKLGDVPEEERAATLAAALAERRPEDERRGMTTVGPHRDDLQVDLDGQPAGDYASQGQSRALVLAFKLAEVRSAKTLLGVPPLLLLDDVSSELDPARSILLFRTLSEDAGQCVLTTTDRRYIELPPEVPRRTVRVERGVIAPDEEDAPP